jgi:nitrate reductase gamma subunit
MDTLSPAQVFVATGAMSLLLGLQSKNVNQSKYLAAAVTSMFIALSQIIFAKAAVSGGAPEYIAMMLGGACGITLSIWIHDTLTNRKERDDKQCRFGKQRRRICRA